MPTGRVKWFDADKGFGFITAESGEQVFLHSSSLPEGAEVKAGTRLDFDMVDGRKGKQVLKARLLEPPVVKRRRRDAETTAVMIEDVIRLLDEASGSLRRGRYPESAHAQKIAEVLRAIADELEG